MARLPSRVKYIFIVTNLLLLSLSHEINGQVSEPRKLFLIDDGAAFIDSSGQVVISGLEPALLEEVKRLSSTFGGFRRTEGEAIRVRFDDFSEGRAVVGWPLCPMCRNPFWVSGIIDETGRLIIPPNGSATRYGSFHEGLAGFSNRGHGFIDRTGRVVIPARFYDAGNFSEGLAYVSLGDERRFGYINQKGRLVISYRFTWASDFHGGLAVVQLSKGKYAYIDKTGKVVLQSNEWLAIDDFSEGLAGVEVEVTDNSVYRGYQDRKYGFIDRTGKFIIPPRFNRVQKFSGGMALFFQTGKSHGYGFIDAKGAFVIKPEYADGRSFSEGLAAMAIKSPDERKFWGYINPQGKWIIEPQFRNVNSFQGALAAVNCDEYGRHCQAYIDREGKIRWESLRVVR
jgi:hypothetical protein